MSKTDYRHSTPKQYTIGFVFSIVLTSLAFISIQWDYSASTIIILLLAFAFAQLVVQLVFFLHLNKEQAPRWNLMMFLMAFWFVLAIVILSIWIMANLNYNMTPEEYESTIQQEEAIFIE